MFRIFSVALLGLVWPAVTVADVNLTAVVSRGVNAHVLPKVAAFEAATQHLVAASAHCEQGAQAIQPTFHQAMDAWTRMSHLRFGPTERDDRAFAIAFWPDGRGKTPKALTALLASDDPVTADPEAFRDISIAARGLYPLEFLLFDDVLSGTGSGKTRCRLVRAIATDLATNAKGIARDWRQSYAGELTQPGAEGRYRSDAEATQELFKALSLGLQFTAETRLGRPLGTFDRPRPKRAELRRSGRSLRQVQLSLESTRELAVILAEEGTSLARRLDDLFAAALQLVAELQDPDFSKVASVQGRLRVEIIQLSINEIRDLVTLELGPSLGVGSGFNALDGD